MPKTTLGCLASHSLVTLTDMRDSQWIRICVATKCHDPRLQLSNTLNIQPASGTTHANIVLRGFPHISSTQTAPMTTPAGKSTTQFQFSTPRDAISLLGGNGLWSGRQSPLPAQPRFKVSSSRNLEMETKTTYYPLDKATNCIE